VEEVITEEDCLEVECQNVLRVLLRHYIPQDLDGLLLDALVLEGLDYYLLEILLALRASDDTRNEVNSKELALLYESGVVEHILEKDDCGLMSMRLGEKSREELCALFLDLFICEKLLYE
jgi:hypothetical protein